MISVFSYDTVFEEQIVIEKGCRYEVAKRTEDSLDFIRALSRDGWPANVDSLDILYCEIQNCLDVDVLKEFRQQESKAMLMLLASASLSPTLYLRPGISPDLLLLKPFTENEFVDANRELFDAFLEKRQVSGEMFVHNTRNGKIRIPYDKISYFEAQNKKINVRTGNKEYDFYGSIEHILQLAPAYFIRCHRSYLVNTRKIWQVRMSEGYIELHSGARVPFSRTYRQQLKDLME